MMNFEELANETFLDLFDYIDGTDLLHTFYGLNFRFNSLLYKQFRSFRLKFNSISKRQFDIICHQHLPFIADRVITLSLSNGDDTPHQIDLFFSHISSINQFTHLQSLSLSYLHTYTTIMKIIDECHHLCHFTHLKLESCYFQNDKIQYQLIIDNIWSLPKLISCNFVHTIGWVVDFCTSTNISSSLERLSFVCYMTKLNQINHLFETTPRLKYLSIIVDDFGYNYLPRILPTLINLNIYVSTTFDISKIICLLQNIPNLHRLNIDLSYYIIDGYQWEQVISNYLPKLKIFHLKMLDLHFPHYRNIQKRMDELIDPFRSSFWIDEHQWFVRCFACETTIYLCTLLDTLSQSICTFPDLFISTHPDDDQQRLCDDMTDIGDERFFDHPIRSNIHLTNIKQLPIRFPIDDQFWSIVPNLNRLQSLVVSANAHTSQSHLQALLDRAPHLYEFAICQDGRLPLQMELLKCTSISVRHLDIQWFAPCFNEEECIALINSPLVTQCEVLSISLDSCENIFNLVHNMNNLRALTVQCNKKIYSNRSLLTETVNESPNKNALDEDAIIHWLKRHLPSTCSIGRVPKFPTDNNIQIWIS